jgi:hypothetical protein
MKKILLFLMLAIVGCKDKDFVNPIVINNNPPPSAPKYRIWSSKFENHSMYVRYFDINMGVSVTLKVTPDNSSQFDNPGWQVFDPTTNQWRQHVRSQDTQLILDRAPIGTEVWEECDGVNLKTHTIDNHTWNDPNLVLSTSPSHPDCI